MARHRPSRLPPRPAAAVWWVLAAAAAPTQALVGASTCVEDLALAHRCLDEARFQNDPSVTGLAPQTETSAVCDSLVTSMKCIPKSCCKGSFWKETRDLLEATGAPCSLPKTCAGQRAWEAHFAAMQIFTTAVIVSLALL